MLEDIIQIQPRKDRNYYAGTLEFAVPVKHPKEKAHHFFRWGILCHARGKPAEAYKWYEKALILDRNPYYLKQMGILHHEMGYLKDALKYIRTAVDMERKAHEERARQKAQSAEYATHVASTNNGQENIGLVYHYAASSDQQ